MLRVFSLILPALIPSWRFFQSVEPAPRIEWRKTDAGGDWQMLFAPPARLGLWAMAWQLVWNAQRNDALYMVTCAERMIDAPSPIILRAIQDRVRRVAAGGASLEFRILFVVRQDDIDMGQELYRSAPFAALP